MSPLRTTGIALALLAFLTLTPVPAEDDAAAVTLTGEVTVHEEDDEGEILSIYLAGTAKGDVLIAKNALWDQLLDYEDEEVEVTGTLSASPTPPFSHQITVTSFRSLDDDDEDDDEDEE